MEILPFTSPAATLASVGGKGANLARLARAGFPVPPGFIISTGAYQRFVATNELQPVIQAALENLSADTAGALEQASAKIRAAFSAGRLPQEITTAILSACENHLATAQLTRGSGQVGEGVPVAVRSSATAEDLPDLSFAGQQDTYLNVIGTENLLEAVVNCWSSLWTGRAIGYRLRNGIDHDEAALAVVVQRMVASDVSGVLFTANPLTGLLSEAVIDATFGLGEALVSGRVEPDHFVVDSRSGEVIHKKLGAKKVATRGKPGGGVETLQENLAARQTLGKEEIRRLVLLGNQVQEEYGTPQDIEWAISGGELYLLQSRSITTLFPVPEVSFDPLIIWFSFGAVQGMMGPVTPLGQDAIRTVIAGMGTVFGAPITPDQQQVFVSSGERIWVKISDLIRHPIGSRIFSGLLGFVEPSVAQILTPLVAEERLGAGSGKMKLSTLRRLARFALPMLPRFARAMLHPEKARADFDRRIEDYLSVAAITPAENRFERLANTLAFMRNRISNAFPFLLPRFIPLFGPSMAALNLLTKISGGRRELALEVTRGLPNNVTTEMDLALWATAIEIRAEADLAGMFQRADAQELANRYLDGSLPATAQAAIDRFMKKYGMRGVGEIDFGQPRWREDPVPVMRTLQSYLTIKAEFAPDVLFARGEQAAQTAIEQLASEARKQAGGWLKEKLVRVAARRIRILMGARESPKFFAIRTMGIARHALLEAGREFVKAGTIDRPDDLVYLQLSELEVLSRNEPPSASAHPSWKALIADRQGIYGRELRRRQVPRVLVSDGRMFYEGLDASSESTEVITGSPVSPGVVEGVVRIVLDPRSTQLSAGEILVCPGTDPAWTPLFMAAGGLITEVGGMMTHGSVVAREFGIPAVVGVHRATERLKNGQRIRLDGTLGKIEIVSRPDNNMVG
ncbi:MAG TPA: PEP/pyruvate-binding domain-containing protein [Anaerolineales bacterium]|nr:PEP/pyruvate-binding domain-containing protein [Anaerolineales bacterium]